MNREWGYIICIVFSFCAQGNAQSDTTWQKSVTGRYAHELVSTTGQPFYVASIEVQAKKASHTLVPMILTKSIYKASGLQYGMAYYKKWKWGYTHIDAFYSSDIVFPSFVGRATGYVTLQHGLEVSAGASWINYTDGSVRSGINLGATYYRGALMSSYVVKVPSTGLIFHRLLLRRYLRSEKDHVQLSFTNGQEQEQVSSMITDPLNVYACHFSIHKTILRKTQVQVSIGTTKASNEKISNQFFTYSIGLKRDL